MRDTRLANVASSLRGMQVIESSFIGMAACQNNGGGDRGYVRDELMDLRDPVDANFHDIPGRGS